MGLDKNERIILRNINDTEHRMTDNTIKKNTIYSMLYNTINVLFPFLTGVYASRVLLPSGIGRVAAAQNLVQYFTILSFLGIPTYGLREISRAGDDEEKRNQIFSELFIINMASTMLFTCFYIVVVALVPTFYEDGNLYYVVGVLVVLNVFNISWLFEGMENFRFISIRNIAFKAISFAFLLLFVRTEDDVVPFALVTVVGTVGNNTINMIHSRRFVRYRFGSLNIKRHLKPILYLASVNLAIELYSLIDITMMNFYCDKDSIAFYKYAQSIERILIQIVNTFTVVLVPRLSFCYMNHKHNEFNKLIVRSLTMIIMFSTPMIMGIYFMSETALVELYGAPYIASATILKLLSVLLLLSPVGYLLGSRVLLVSGNEKHMIIPVGCGALVNIIGNMFLIPRFYGDGAALASVISEIVVMVIYIIMGSKYYIITGIKESIIKIVLANVLTGVILFWLKQTSLAGWKYIIVSLFAELSVYTIVLYLLRENTFIGLITVTSDEQGSDSMNKL